MQDPDRLRVSGQSLHLADRIFDYTEEFPRTQRFVLVSQMQRAVVSIGSNIFEGCGKPSNRGLVASLYTAMGSASELDFQLRLSRRRQFGNQTLAEELASEIIAMKRSLSLLIKHQP